MSIKAHSSIEKRTLKRWQLIFYLRVFDQDSRTVLGYVVDISTDGMMLLSDQPLTLNKDYNLYIEVPQDDGTREKILLKAHSLWSNKDVNPEFFDTGFRLIDTTAEQVFKIQLSIDDFKLHQ